MKWNETNKKSDEKQSLRIPGKLPFDKYGSEIKIADLARMLVHTGALTVRDFFRLFRIRLPEIGKKM